MSCTKHPSEAYKILCTKQKQLCSNKTLKRNKLKFYISSKDTKLACFANELRLISGIWFVWLMICDFSKKVIESACFFVVPAWHLKSQQGTQKNCAPEFLILSALKLTSYGLVVFVNMKIYILTEAKISKHSWHKIMKLVWIVATYLIKKC